MERRWRGDREEIEMKKVKKIRLSEKEKRREWKVKELKNNID